jgi:hypothetical protein
LRPNIAFLPDISGSVVDAGMNGKHPSRYQDIRDAARTGIASIASIAVMRVKYVLGSVKHSGNAGGGRSIKLGIKLTD